MVDGNASVGSKNGFCLEGCCGGWKRGGKATEDTNCMEGLMSGAL